MLDLTQIAIGLFTVVGVPLLGLLAVAVSKKAKEWKALANQEYLQYALDVVDYAVKAAEQRGYVAKIKKIAFDKKTWVVEQVQKELDAAGVKIDASIVDNYIESKVAELNWSKLDS